MKCFSYNNEVQLLFYKIWFQITPRHAYYFKTNYKLHDSIPACYVFQATTMLYEKLSSLLASTKPATRRFAMQLSGAAQFDRYRSKLEGTSRQRIEFSTAL